MMNEPPPDDDEPLPPPPPQKKARTVKRKARGKLEISSDNDAGLAYSASPKNNMEDDPEVVRALRQLDPLLQFLTRRSGKLTFPLSTLRSILPTGYDANQVLEHVIELHRRGIFCLFQVEEKVGTSSLSPLEQGYYDNQGNDPPLASRISSTASILYSRDGDDSVTWNSPYHIGFPPPPSVGDDDFHEKQTIQKTIGSLHGTTKAAAQRRLRALKKSLKERPNLPSDEQDDTPRIDRVHGRHTGSAVVVTPLDDSFEKGSNSFTAMESVVVQTLQNLKAAYSEEPADESQADLQMTETEREARRAMKLLFQLKEQQRSTRSGKPLSLENDTISGILPDQVSYAGTQDSRTCQYERLSPDVARRIPSALLEAYGLLESTQQQVLEAKDEEKDDGESFPNHRRRMLYCHQVAAIEYAMNRVHTLVCTSTGSGKSLCFWLPVLSAAYHASCSSSAAPTSVTMKGTSFVIFPTKALAQDQLSQLKRLLASDSNLERHIRPATLDGDTPHSMRVNIAEQCNVILTNPDTIHSAILPNWRTMYEDLLGKLDFVVLDEAHLYEGVFGAHVSLVLSRLHRICAVASQRRYQNLRSRDGANLDRPQRLLPTYLACSATMSHPEHQFRLLFPIAKEESITVFTADHDGSPRSAKHFFVWNPPILDKNGLSINRVTIPRSSLCDATPHPQVSQRQIKSRVRFRPANRRNLLYSCEHGPNENGESFELDNGDAAFNAMKLHRRHAAEETALLLAKAVTSGVRCIAFCKTRMVVEWVYEKTVAALRSVPATAHLASKVESYRGGYNTTERRMIEQRLFQNEVLGVVATCALEVGVDIGGIDVTLHCGYPTSYASLLQQAGRAGRGVERLDVPSVAVMVCFNSPAEQHIWRHPTRLLNQALTSIPSMPFNLGVVQGHMLCASEEFPLTGCRPLIALQQTTEIAMGIPMLCDDELFGSKPVYEEALQTLVSMGSVVADTVAIHSDHGSAMTIYKAHPSANKPWMRMSLRSVEPVNYSVVDISHPGQRGRTDGIHDQSAVMDHLPYSRVFYHAFPGAIITHRGKRYLVESMTRPPPIMPSFSSGGGCTLAAYAKPTTARYITRPLSTLQTTIVKQMERLDLADLCGKAAGLNTSFGALDDLPVQSQISDFPGLSFAGCGVLNVKRSVHGFKKLSMATLAELSRTEISMPTMEFDTFGIWIDADACNLSSQLIDYGSGVHALSHALLAVSPLFVNCSLSDLDCEHAYFDPTRVVLFDARPGGLGTCAQLWKCLFAPKGLLDSAIELLENCTTCSADTSYKGGCPACLQSVKCMKFNLHLSKHAGLAIAKRMRQRLDESGLFDNEATSTTVLSTNCDSPDRAKSNLNLEASKSNTPRRKARAKALDLAKDIQAARDRSIVVGRPAWPLDGEHGGAGRQEKPE